MKNDSDSSTKNESITYTLGYVEAKIAEIARNLDESESQLREWVGILLLSSGTGIINNLSSLRGNSPKVYKTIRKMAVDEHTHSKTRGKNTPRKVAESQAGPSNKLGYKYNGTHWMQKPENKERVIKMMRARHAAIRAARAKKAKAA